MRLVEQITPRTCFQACFESFLWDHGVEFSQAQMLVGHRDIHAVVAQKMGDVSLFGTLEEMTFTALCNRFLWQVQPVSAPSAKALESILHKPEEGVIVWTESFKETGDSHAIRLSEVQNDVVVYMDPSDASKLWEASVTDLLQTWKGHPLRLFR